MGQRGHNGVIEHLWGNQSMRLLTKVSSAEWLLGPNSVERKCERNVDVSIFSGFASQISSNTKDPTDKWLNTKQAGRKRRRP